nr:MAG TPA: nin one binding protein [Caudoviricetes sp.]
MLTKQERLADLIDPTCHDFGGEEDTNGENYDFACSACGWCGDMTNPNYCPNCGARVVRDE